MQVYTGYAKYSKPSLELQGKIEQRDSRPKWKIYQASSCRGNSNDKGSCPEIVNMATLKPKGQFEWQPSSGRGNLNDPGSRREMENMATLEPKGKIEQGGSRPKVGNTQHSSSGGKLNNVVNARKWRLYRARPSRSKQRG
jgi:hypothetical protein